MNGDFHLEVDNWRLKDAITELERGFGGEFAQYRNASLGPFLDTLSKILRVDTSKMSYMDDFLLRNSDRLECIATLNYDQLIEVSQENRGEKVDLGLSSWNEKRFVRFHGQSLKLVKLHGSTDWYIQNHDEIIIDRENKGFSRSRAMIFGGQGDKLVPYGPFLHLRHQFQQFLQSSSYLLVVGYSFQDLHLNALIRSWIATRRSGKIIIVDPNPGQFSSDIFQYAYQRDSRGNPKGRRVEIKQIKEKFSNSLGEIQEELEKSPNLSL